MKQIKDVCQAQVYIEAQVIMVLQGCLLWGGSSKLFGWKKHEPKMTWKGV